MSSIPEGSGIYRITCTVTGLIYIGSANNMRRRWSQHLSDLRNNKHINQKLQRAWNKYKEPNFLFEIVEFVLPTFLLEREQYWFDKLKPFGKKGFNIAISAQSARLGLTHTPETREKLRQANLGKPSPTRGIKRSPETIEKLRKALTGNTNRLGKTFTPESREKMRLSHLGQVSHNKGKKASLETRAKISAARKGKPGNRLGSKASPETLAKMSAARKGKPNPHPGVPHTPETRAKIAAAGLGRKHTLESRAKMSANARGNARSAKDYIVTSPDGAEYKVHNLSEFCKEHNLTQSSLSSVAVGKRKHHKGWTARLFPEAG